MSISVNNSTDKVYISIWPVVIKTLTSANQLRNSNAKRSWNNDIYLTADNQHHKFHQHYCLESLEVCWREMETLLNCFFPLPKRVFSTRTEFAPPGANSVLLEEIPFLKGLEMQEDKKEIKNDPKENSNIYLYMTYSYKKNILAQWVKYLQTVWNLSPCSMRFTFIHFSTLALTFAGTHW